MRWAAVSAVGLFASVCVHRRSRSLTSAMTDTLLNVFLAIAVDNLANAQELTKVRAPTAGFGATESFDYVHAAFSRDCMPRWVCSNSHMTVSFTRTKRRKRNSSTSGMPEAGTASYPSKFLWEKTKRHIPTLCWQLSCSAGKRPIQHFGPANHKLWVAAAPPAARWMQLVLPENATFVEECCSHPRKKKTRADYCVITWVSWLSRNNVIVSRNKVAQNNVLALHSNVISLHFT